MHGRAHDTRQIWGFLMARSLRLLRVMRLGSFLRRKGGFVTPQEHSFAIGPVEGSDARERSVHYFCTRCRWSFSLTGRRIVALDDCGRTMIGAEAERRIATFAGGPCPALAILREFENSRPTRAS